MESDVISALPGCYLLVILGEPLSDNHNEKILQRVAKGLLSWNTESTQCDLKHLEHVCDNFKIEKQEAFETEILLQHSNDRLAVEVLFNPHIFTFKQCLRNLLLSPTGHKHIIYAGYSFNGSGSWILQDGIFRFNDFLDELSDPSVLKVLSLNSNGSTGEMHLHCHPIGDWVINKLDDQPFSHLLNVSLNPADSPNGVPGASHLLDFIENSLATLSKKDHLESSSLTGNIKFERPTMYIFPSGQGDCSLLGITGFTMLIDGGFPRFPCFWKFIRHIETLDTIMITRINESNIWGILSLLKSKQEYFMYPKIGYVFCNIGDSGEVVNSTKEGNMTSIQSDKNDLIISLIEMGKEIANSLKQIKCNPHQCIRESPLNPLILYQKVGHGTLEMYVLNPAQESKLLKEFLSHWSSNKDSLPVVRSRSALQNKEKSDQDIAIPVSDLMSICCLVIWKPSDPLDRITRILFPGSAPQNQIMEGLSMLKGLDLINSRVCTGASLETQSKQKATTKTSVKKNETSVPSTRYRSVSPTHRKSYTKHVANDLLDKGKSDSQSSAIKRKVNVSSIHKEDHSSKKVDEGPIEKSALDKKTPRGITGRKPRSKTESTATATVVSESSEVASDSSEKQVNSVVSRQVRIRSSDKMKETKKVKKVSTQETKENTDDGVSSDKKSEPSHEIPCHEDNHPDSGKGSENASPRKFPFHLRDEVEPDSLESCEIYGNVEISQDSLEHSEDGAITCDSQSISQLDQVISLDDEMKSWSSPTHLNHEPQSMMLSSLSSNVSEMTMVSGTRKESQSDLEVTSLNLRIENDQTSSSIDTSLAEENCSKSKKEVLDNIIKNSFLPTGDDNNEIDDKQSPAPSDSDVHKSINIKNEDTLEIESGTVTGIVDSHISQLEFVKEDQLTDDRKILEPQTSVSQELHEDQTVEDKVVTKPQASKRLSVGVELSKEDSESLETTENTVIETHAKDEMATDGDEVPEKNEMGDKSDGNSERLPEIILENQNAVIVEDKSLSDTKSAESSTAMPEERETGDSKIVINEGSIEENTQRIDESMVLGKEIENCDNETQENSTLNENLAADEKTQEKGEIEHLTPDSKVLTSELDEEEKSETHDKQETEENEKTIKISDVMSADVDEASFEQIIRDNEITDDLVQEDKPEAKLEDSLTAIPGEKTTGDSKFAFNEDIVEETTEQELQVVNSSVIKDHETCDKIEHEEGENETLKGKSTVNEILPDKFEIEHSVLESRATYEIDDELIKTEKLDELEADENLIIAAASNSLNADKQKSSTDDLSVKADIMDTVHDTSTDDEIVIADKSELEISGNTAHSSSTDEKVQNARRESIIEESKVLVCEKESSQSKQIFRRESEDRKMDAVDKSIDTSVKGDEDKTSKLSSSSKKKSIDDAMEQNTRRRSTIEESKVIVCEKVSSQISTLHFEDHKIDSEEKTMYDSKQSVDSEHKITSVKNEKVSESNINEHQNIATVAFCNTSDENTMVLEKSFAESSEIASRSSSIVTESSGEKRKMSTQSDDKSVEVARKSSTHEITEKTNMNENNSTKNEVKDEDSKQQFVNAETKSTEKIVKEENVSKSESTAASDVINMETNNITESSVIESTSSTIDEKRKMSIQKDENGEQSATASKEIEKSIESKRKSVTHEVSELKEIQQTTKGSEVTFSKEQLIQSEIQFDFGRMDVINIEINDVEKMGAAANESEPESPSPNDPKKTDAETKQIDTIEVKETQDTDIKKDEKLNVDATKETSSVDKMTERCETVQASKESESTYTKESIQFELSSFAVADNGPELKEKISLQTEVCGSDKYEDESGKAKKTELPKVAKTDENLASIEEKDVQGCDTEVDEKQEADKLYETSTKADMIKHAENLEKSTKDVKVFDSCVETAADLSFQNVFCSNNIDVDTKCSTENFESPIDSIDNSQTSCFIRHSEEDSIKSIQKSSTVTIPVPIGLTHKNDSGASCDTKMEYSKLETSGSITDVIGSNKVELKLDETKSKKQIENCLETSITPNSHKITDDVSSSNLSVISSVKSTSEVEPASSINIQQYENNLATKLEAEVGITSVHVLKSTQLLRQNLYQIPDEEETVEGSITEKTQIDLSHERTKSIEYPEVLHITESTTTSPSETTRNPPVGTQANMDNAGTSSMTTMITSPESTQSRLCCFPVSMEETTNDKEKKTKEIANESESFDTYNSQNLTEQQIKCKEATLKEWGNPLGLPKPPSSVYKPSQTTTKSRAKSSDRNEHLKHSTRRTGLGSDSIKPIYLDLAYIPHHGDRHYCNAEYFKKVRARYYVLSGVNPSKEVLDALITGKQSWSDKETETTLIPSHESEALCLWMATNQKTLEILNIDVAPSASRCSVILQGQESSCSAYRVEF